MDQQLGRVRNPGAVKVWISDEEEYFETDPKAIRLELIHTGKADTAITGFKGDGEIIFNEDEPLLNLRAEVYAAVRASLNRLKFYFLQLKEHNGWRIKHIGAGADSDKPDGLESAAEAVEQCRIENLLAAARIDQNRYWELINMRENGEPIGVAGRWEVARHEIEWFYGEEISEQLIRLDDDGKYRNCVERYEGLALHRDFGEVEHALAQFWLNSDWRASFTNKTEWLLDAILIASNLAKKNGFDSGELISLHKLEHFVAICRDRKQSLETDFNIRLRRNFEHKPVETLSRVLALIGLGLVPDHFEKVKGKRSYYYRLDTGRFETMLRTVQRRREVKQERNKDDVALYADLLKAKHENRFGKIKSDSALSQAFGGIASNDLFTDAELDEFFAIGEEEDGI